MRKSVDNPMNVHCTGCGACVSESNGALTMQWNDEGFFLPRVRTKGLPIPITAIKVCPFNPRPERTVEDEDAIAKHFISDAPHFDAKGGSYRCAFIGYSKEFRETSSSGGIATYVFKALLEGGHVDHLFVVVSDDEGGYRYALHSDVKSIGDTSKTRYFPVTLEKLFVILDGVQGTVAVSGVACFIKAIRLKQFYHPDLKLKIPFLLGIICGGLKSKFFTEFLAQNAGVEGRFSNPDYRIKDVRSTANDYSFGAYDQAARFHKMKMSVVGDMWGTGLFKSAACDFCTDVLTELADISLGDAWLPKYKGDGLGNNVVVCRSALAESLLRTGIERGELALSQVSIEQIVESQRASFAHRHDALRFRVFLAKFWSPLSTPVLRGRLMRSISIPFAIVQMLRARVRYKSIEYWKLKPNVTFFNGQISRELTLLRFFTKLYHKTRRK